MKTVEERFKEKFIKQGVNKCWLWEGSMNEGGYGWIRVDNKWIKAHRLSYTIYRGIIPKGLFVCHTCDVRNCVNPNHLWLGTNKDNVNDMLLKGRIKRASGEKSGKSKLTESKVAEIRSNYVPWKYTMARLSKEYGVSQSNINSIISGGTWNSKILKY